MTLNFLSGFRVVELTQYLPGPAAALILADLGAEVVSVEPPGGEPMRRLGPLDGDGVSAFWKLLHRGKTVVELDLKSPAGKEGFAQLLAAADVLVESLRPGVLDRLGFPRERLSALNPRLVHASLSGFGQTGPWRLYPGHDLNYMALGGGLAVSGTPAGPVMTLPPIADHASAVTTAMAVAAALLGRITSGKGCHLDLSLAESVLAWQPLTLTAALREGFQPVLGANLLNGGVAFYQIYRASDGRFVSLGAIEDKFWANFCNAVGRPDWIARQWEELPQRALIAEVAAVMATKTAAEWGTLLEGAECCFAVIVEPRAVPDHPQVAARGMVERQLGAEPTVEVLFPAWVDGKPPGGRSPVAFSTAAEIAARWSGPQG